MCKRLIYKIYIFLIVFILIFNSIKINTYAAAPQLDPNDFARYDLFEVLEGGGGQNLDPLTVESVQTICLGEFEMMALAEGVYAVDELVTEFYNKCNNETFETIRNGSYHGDNFVYTYKGKPYMITSGFYGIDAVLMDTETYECWCKEHDVFDVDGNIKNVEEATKKAFGYMYDSICNIGDLINTDTNWVVTVNDENSDLSDWIRTHMVPEVSEISFTSSDQVAYSYVKDAAYLNGYITNKNAVFYSEFFVELHVLSSTDGYMKFYGSKPRMSYFEEFGEWSWGGQERSFTFNWKVNVGDENSSWPSALDLTKGSDYLKKIGDLENHIFIKKGVNPSVVNGNRYNLGNITYANNMAGNRFLEGVNNGTISPFDPYGDNLPEYEIEPIVEPIKYPEAPTVPGVDPDPGVDPNPGVDPDPGVDPNPGIDPNPGVDPDPGVDPNPGIIPDPSVNPGINPTPESNLESIKLHDLRLFFPFCIPFDLYDCIKLLVADPVDPIWKIPLKIIKNPMNGGYMVDTVLVIDLTQYELPTLFKVMRTIQVFCFIILLAVITKKFIY